MVITLCGWWPSSWEGDHPFLGRLAHCQGGLLHQKSSHHPNMMVTTQDVQSPSMEGVYKLRKPSWNKITLGSSLFNCSIIATKKLCPSKAYEERKNVFLMSFFQGLKLFFFCNYKIRILTLQFFTKLLFWIAS